MVIYNRVVGLGLSQTLESVDFRSAIVGPFEPEPRKRGLEKGGKDSCCRVPLSRSIFASLGAYFRTYLHALDKRASLDTRAWFLPTFFSSLSLVFFFLLLLSSPPPPPSLSPSFLLFSGFESSVSLLSREGWVG